MVTHIETLHFEKGYSLDLHSSMEGAVSRSQSDGFFRRTDLPSFYVITLTKQLRSSLDHLASPRKRRHCPAFRTPLLLQGRGMAEIGGGPLSRTPCAYSGGRFRRLLADTQLRRRPDRADAAGAIVTACMGFVFLSPMPSRIRDASHFVHGIVF